MSKKVLMVIASSQFRDEEYAKPRRILESAGVGVTVASSSLKEAAGMLGLKVTPDILLKDAKMSEYDAVIFVGGMGATEYWTSKEAHALAKESFDQKKPTAAICLAPMTLANAGLLKGKRATIWEKDGQIITGSGPDAAEEFGRTLLDALKTVPAPK